MAVLCPSKKMHEFYLLYRFIYSLITIVGKSVKIDSRKTVDVLQCSDSMKDSGSIEFNLNLIFTLSKKFFFRNI